MTNELPPNATPDSQALLNQVIIDYIREQKRRRRWRWFMRVIYLLILCFIAYVLAFNGGEESGSNTKPHVGLIDLNWHCA